VQLKAVIFIFVAMLCLGIAGATSIYNQVYMSPFYRASTTSGMNYTYSLSVSPYSDRYDIYSAILSFDVYFTPTVVFTIWVNNQRCNTADYTISTTYSGSSQGRIRFDCANVINKSGIYSVKISATKNTGAIVGWLDMTFLESTRG
jgi:hypothetical protein